MAALTRNFSVPFLGTHREKPLFSFTQTSLVGYIHLSSILDETRETHTIKNQSTESTDGDGCI